MVVGGKKKVFVPLSMQHENKGCQIFLDKTCQDGENIPTYHKIYQNAVKYCQIDQMAIKYTCIFYRKTLQNLPKLVFLVRKRTIWQPR
jgi:predicted aldo/keto reductase-like oxidoreductase